MKTNKIIGLSIVTVLSLAPFMEAGKIGPLVNPVEPAQSSGFGGWNLSNVNVKITDLDYKDIDTKSFDPATGSYTLMKEDETFESEIKGTVTIIDSDNSATIFANLHGKDWPVGEPAGIKVIEEGPAYNSVLTHSKPANCLITNSFLEGTYLDSLPIIPSETLCSSDFQTHKRFKLNLLPTMYTSTSDAEIILAGGYGEGVNLTFNVQDDTNAWRYMVLQKINNYTDKRLYGYKLELGFLDGDGVFTTASANEADIKLSIGTGEDEGSDIWDENELATFSNGLFGAADKHFDTNGFFDIVRAGYKVELNDSKDTIKSVATLGSNYTSLFGNWPSESMAPKGIFFDDDNNIATDPMLMAFWADLDGDGTFAWTKGIADNFELANEDELALWKGEFYEEDIIEDVLNLGLTYIVEIGNIETFPEAANGTFTIRATPKFAPIDDITELPSKGILYVSPAPTFTVGNTLTFVVADNDLSTEGSVAVKVTTTLGESEVITLTKILSPGVFTADLATVSESVAGASGDMSINVVKGTVVTVTYVDADIDGAGGTADVVVSTTAEVAPVASISSSSVSSEGSSSGAVNDNISLLFTIFGFLLIGGLIVRRKLA